MLQDLSAPSYPTVPRNHRTKRENVVLESITHFGFIKKARPNESHFELGLRMAELALARCVPHIEETPQFSLPGLGINALAGSCALVLEANLRHLSARQIDVLTAYLQQVGPQPFDRVLLPTRLISMAERKLALTGQPPATGMEAVNQVPEMRALMERIFPND